MIVVHDDSVTATTACFSKPYSVKYIQFRIYHPHIDVKSEHAKQI